MAEHEWVQEATCDACDATGVYVGLAERDGSAVVCHKCKGTGKRTIKIRWDDFENRKRRKGIRRVVEFNPGICIGEGNGHRLEEFGGMDYTLWFRGLAFQSHSEMREFTCPAWWYQSANYSKKPHWDECIGIGSFSSCKHFDDKRACWERFDEETE